MPNRLIPPEQFIQEATRIWFKVCADQGMSEAAARRLLKRAAALVGRPIVMHAEPLD